MKLEQKLHDIRIERGISQETLAERVNVSRQTISKWENGAARPSAGSLAALSEVFGLPMEAFLKEDWVPPEKPEPVMVEVPVEVPVPVPAPKNYRLWAILLAVAVAVGIVVGALLFQDRSEEPVSWSGLDIKVEVIDPATLADPIPFLPFEED